MRSGYRRRAQFQRKAFEFAVDSVVGGAMFAAVIALALGLIVLYCVEL